MKTALPEMYDAQIVTKERATPSTYLVQLETTKPVSYQSGQYASWLINETRRPFSFARPANNTKVEFLIDTSPGGLASRYISGLSIGDKVQFLAPYGRFTVDHEDSHPLLFIATGTGIAPLRAHIYEELAKENPRPITLVFGNRDHEHIPFFDEFTALACDKTALFTFTPTCLEPLPGWTGECGSVADIASRLLKPLSSFTAYICGNPAMVKDTALMLKNNSVPPERIHTEQY